MTAESAVTPTVNGAFSLISSASLIVIACNLFRMKKKGHEWPRVKIISASKAENKKKWHKSVVYKDFSE